MSTTLALIIGFLVLAGLGLDLLTSGGQVFLFLAAKFADLVEWLAFWR